MLMSNSYEFKWHFEKRTKERVWKRYKVLVQLRKRKPIEKEVVNLLSSCIVGQVSIISFNDDCIRIIVFLCGECWEMNCVRECVERTQPCCLVLLAYKSSLPWQPIGGALTCYIPFVLFLVSTRFLYHLFLSCLHDN